MKHFFVPVQLAALCTVALAASVHDSIDSAYLHAGLNPVHSKPNSKGTELVIIPLDGAVHLENGLGQSSNAAKDEIIWLSAGSGSVITLKSTSGSNSGALLLVFDTPLSRKAEQPHFQHFAKAALQPFKVPTASGVGSMVLYSGAMHEHHGPVHSYTVALVGIARFAEGAVGELHIPAPKTGMLFVLQGKARFGGSKPGTGGRLGRFGSTGQLLRLTHPTRFGGVQHDKEHAHHRFAKAGTGFTDDVWVHNIAGHGELVVAIVGGLPAQHGDEVNVRGAVSLPAGADLQQFFSDAQTGHWTEKKGHFHTPTSHGHSAEDGPTLAELEEMAGMEHSHRSDVLAGDAQLDEEEDHDEL